MTVKYQFGGVVNAHDPATLAGIRDSKGRVAILSEMAKASNVDISDRMTVRRRQGQTLALAGTQHSMWAPPDESICLFVEGATLKRFWGMSATVIATLTSNTHCVFEPAGLAIVYSNGVDIGIIEHATSYGIPVPTRRFKGGTPAGKHLAYFNGRLYVLKDGVMYHTDPYNLEQIDSRKSQVLTPGAGNMLAAVDGGLWLSTEKAVFFLSGTGPEDFVWRQALDYPAIPWAYKKVFGEKFGMTSDVVIFATPQGFCLGSAGGEVKNLSRGKVSLPTGERGAVAVRERDGQSYIIAAMQGVSSAHNYYTPKAINLTTTEY